MKIGINLKINVNKIKKEKLFKGKKGNYLNLVAFLDIENSDQFGNHGIIKQQGDKNEDMPILGNARIFKREGIQENKQQESNEFQKQQETPEFNGNNFDYDIPF